MCTKDTGSLKKKREKTHRIALRKRELQAKKSPLEQEFLAEDTLLLQGLLVHADHYPADGVLLLFGGLDVDSLTLESEERER
jgi:hypothetical protein